LRITYTIFVYFDLKIGKNIKDLEASFEEKCTAIQKLTEDASGLKNKVESLTSSLAELENEYQV
jgi:chromosome segregation ATPase